MHYSSSSYYNSGSRALYYYWHKLCTSYNRSIDSDIQAIDYDMMLPVYRKYFMYMLHLGKVDGTCVPVGVRPDGDLPSSLQRCKLLVLQQLDNSNGPSFFSPYPPPIQSRNEDTVVLHIPAITAKIPHPAARQ